MKRFFFLFSSTLLLLSCSYINNEKAKKELIQKVDTLVDFNSVDAFPVFPNCKDIPSRNKQQICFQLEMSQCIYNGLKDYKITVSDSLKDTVYVKLKIDAAGKTSLSGVKISEKTKKLVPEFDSILQLSIDKLPKLDPAIKRNMPVTTEFTLPIVLKN